MSRKRPKQQRKAGHKGPAPHYRSKQTGQRGKEHSAAPTPPVKSSTPSRLLSLEPLAPLVIRSGRPFDDQAGVDPARFPPPSTTSGCLRTAWARQIGEAFSDKLARLGLRGPLLARPDAKGKLQVLVPKPADALYFGHGDKARCVRAEPLAYADDCGSDLPTDLTPLQLAEPQAEKPGKGPQWWTLQQLLDFRCGTTPSHAELCTHGWSPPDGELRTHVRIDPDTGAAAASQLFQTQGLDLSLDHDPTAQANEPQQGQKPASTANCTSLRLLLRSDEPLAPALVHLGGKRRLAALEPEPADAWPKPSEDWWQRIRDDEGLTLTLLTPALFDAGYRPGWLGSDLKGSPPQAGGLRLQLVAAANERWQPQSGWDLANRRPRPTRKLVPAGATYWLRLLEPGAADDLPRTWLTSLCDQPQDRLDGFGLALPAPWTPPPTTPNITD